MCQLYLLLRIAVLTVCMKMLHQEYCLFTFTLATVIFDYRRDQRTSGQFDELQWPLTTNCHLTT